MDRKISKILAIFLVALGIRIVSISAKLPPSVRVGSIFLEEEQEIHEAFRLAVVSLKSRQLLNETDVGFDIQYAQPQDFFHLYTRACVEVNYGIVSLFGPSDKQLDTQLQSLSSSLGIPLISTAPRPRDNGMPMGMSMALSTLSSMSSGSSSSGHHRSNGLTELAISHTDLTVSIHPSQEMLVAMVKDLVKELNWKDISIIHDPLHGIIEPTSLAESLQMLGTVSINQASTDLRATLVGLRLKGARNIIIDTTSEHIQTVLQALLDCAMTTKAYSYIFTMLDMKSGNWTKLSYSEALVFGFNIIDESKFNDFQERYAKPSGDGQQQQQQQQQTTDEISGSSGQNENQNQRTKMNLKGTTKVALTLDAVELLARGLEAFEESGSDFSNPPTAASCSSEGRKWDVGEELKDAFNTVVFDGVTGPISFSNGVRSRAVLDILKLEYKHSLEIEGHGHGHGIHNDNQNQNQKIHERDPSPGFLIVGNWSRGLAYSSSSSSSSSSSTTETETSSENFNYNYKEGLVMRDRTMLTGEKTDINRTLIISSVSSSCLHKNEVTGEEEGFCADLAFHLSQLIGFYYKFRIVSDGRYGKPDPITGQWDGMIGEVVRGEADLALADLTVTAARENAVDFTAPFMHTSLAILYKNPDPAYSTDGVWTLVSPLSIWVWVSIALAFFITSVSLRFVAYISPFQKDEIIVPGSEHSSTLGQDLSWINSMWLLASTLVLRGCDIRLQAVSSRTIAVVWWLFSLLILIIYASLVPHWLDPFTAPQVHNLETLLKTNMDFGIIRGGSTNYFMQNVKRQDLQRLWWRIQKTEETRGLQSNIQEGIEQVRMSNGDFAFMSEERNFQSAMTEDCSLALVGGIDLRSFAAAVAKGSELREKISEGILTLRETGVLQQLESKWWPSPSCAESLVGDRGPFGSKGKPQVQLLNFIGPLTLLIFGIVFAILIAMTERLFYHRRSHRGFFRTSTGENGNGKIAINTMHDTESS